MTILVAASSTAAENRPTPSVTVEVMRTPAEQLKLGERLIQKVWKADTQQARDHAIASADLHLAVIPQRWPDAKNAIVGAAIYRADILLTFMRPYNALDALQTARSAAVGQDLEPALLRRLGDALDLLNRRAEAEAAYREAEGHRAFGKLAVGEKVLLLKASATLYSRTGRSEQSAPRFRRLSDLRELDPASRAWWRILAARELTGQAGAAIAADVAVAERLLDESERSGRSDRRQIGKLRSAIASLKKAHGL
ncbi:MAG TPA: hypothetical protein VF883_17760 [Thermoanaerobaculia bacterium]